MKNEMDIQAALEEIERLKRGMEALEEKNATLSAQKAALEEKNEEQRLRILYLERQIFGRRSEKTLPKVNEAQYSLMDALFGEETLEAEQGVRTIVEEIEREGVARRAKAASEKKTTTRKADYQLPAELERRTTVIEPELEDAGEYEKIGTDITERLMMEPSRFYVERIERPIYKRKANQPSDGRTEIQQAPLPPNAVAGKVGNSVLSSIVVNKYCHHIPEYRQAKIFRESKVDLPTTTINRLIHKLADVLHPLYLYIVDETLKHDYIQIDETTVKINDRKGKTRKGYIWAVRAVYGRMQFFYYREGSRSAGVCNLLLKDYEGTFQSDGYAVYSQYEEKKGVIPLGCMAHVRRKFETAYASGSESAKKALDYIAALYTLEANLKAAGADFETRKRERMEKAWPILEAMEKWMEMEWTRCTPKSDMGKAISYAHGMWIRIGRYCLDGRFEIDNNAIERAIRPVTLGRKNYLFCGNDECAEDTALYYTLVGCCNEAGVDPLAWFNHVLQKIRPDMTEKELHDLLPCVCEL